MVPIADQESHCQEGLFTALIHIHTYIHVNDECTYVARPRRIIRAHDEQTPTGYIHTGSILGAAIMTRYR